MTAPATREWVTSGSVAKLLAWRVAEAYDAPFLQVETEEPWTFGELATAATTVRDALVAARVGRGQRVAVRLPNDERFLIALQAVWWLGATPVLIHSRAPDAEVSRVAAALEVTAAVAEAPFAAGVEVVPVERRRPAVPLPVAGLPPVPDVGDDEPALVLLTSGSTGTPKGVPLSHRNTWANLRATVTAFRSDGGPTPLADASKPPNLLASPLTHTAGVVRLLFGLYVGRRLVLMRKFDAALAARLVREHRINNLTINPTMLRMLLTDVTSTQDLATVRYVSSGTAPLPAGLKQEFEARFSVPVIQTYGMTEAFGALAIEDPRDARRGIRRDGSVGKAVAGVELRIVDPTTLEPLPHGTEGEIWARSKAAMRGYLGGGDAEHEARQGEWLRTGDLGRLDADGYLYVTGRLKNVIICGGFNIYPEEIETSISKRFPTTESVAVAVPDDRLGEIPVALVEGAHDEREITAWLARDLPSHKRPRRLFVIAALPRVSNGKIDRPAAALTAARLTLATGQSS